VDETPQKSLADLLQQGFFICTFAALKIYNILM
jgi:hypothetical protein